MYKIYIYDSYDSRVSSISSLILRDVGTAGTGDDVRDYQGP